MMKYQVDPKRCSGCGLCAEACPEKAILIEAKQAILLTGQCNGCGDCETVCRRGAIQAVESVPQPVSQPVVAFVGRGVCRRGRHQRWRPLHWPGRGKSPFRRNREFR